MTMHAIVLTLIGEDRPGLVDAVSDCVASHGGNWEESRMAHLGGQFVGLLRLTVPEDKREPLEAALRGLTAQGLSVHSKDDGDARRPAPPRGQRVRLDITSQDREGVVRDVSRVLADRAINVEELSTNCESAPMCGEIIFRATALLRLPSVAAGEGLKAQLEALGDELIVDLQPIPEPKPAPALQPAPEA